MSPNSQFSKYKQFAVTGLPIIGIVLSLTICIYVIYIGYQFYRSVEDTALESCIGSIRQSLSTTLENQEVKRIINPDQEWRVLSKTERNFLLNHTDNPKRYDCANYPFFTEGKTKRGKELQISVRQTDHYVDVIIDGLE
jgi:hypothetical protein